VPRSGPDHFAEALLQATGAGDDASVLADEVRARLADNARELAELNEPGASPP
jgi:ABC-type transporter Mla subunit MlaD